MSEKNYSVTNAGSFQGLKRTGRVMLGETLGLTGCEMSFNYMQAGQGSQFVHAHRLNEEVYIIVQGAGIFWADGSELPVQEGSVVRVAPACQRALQAAADADLVYICIQAQAGSLTQATQDDGVLSQTKAAWMA